MTFAFLGGPLYRLGRRLGLVRGDTNTVLLGLALGGGTWAVCVVLAVAAGIADRMFSLALIGGHMRLLVVIPLFFICESWVAPRMTAFVRRIADTGVVPATDLPSLNALLARVGRVTDAWWPETGCLLVAIVLLTTGARLTYGESAAYNPGRSAAAAWVYYRFGLVLFQFLMFRWGWRFVLWAWFLWRVSRLDLQLMPGHPDGAGGLDSVEGVHERFAPLVAAISVLQCAALVEDLSTGVVAITSTATFLAVLLLVDAIVFLGPLFVFTDKLWAARTKGVGAYMSLAARYVTGFERKWLDGAPPDAEMLGTADIQSLADLANSINIVSHMRWVPIGPRLMIQLTAAALAPLLPLLLFRYPAAELAQKFFARLLGF